MTINGYVCVNKNDGSLMGIDRDSGGYPWDAYKPGNHVVTLSLVEFYPDEIAAKRNVEMFPEYELKRFVLEIQD